MGSEQLEVLQNSLCTLMSGFCLVLVFDIIKVFFEEINISAIKTFAFVGDALFLLSFNFLFVLILYYFNNGAFRGIYLVAIVLGTCIYFVLFKTIINKIVRVILKPVTYLIFVLIKNIKRIYKFLLYGIEKITFRMYNIFRKNKINNEIEGK